MYFPVGLWELLVRSPLVRGPRGGIAIGYESASRRFSNSEFTSLLSKGWLGTCGVDTDTISEILVESLGADHSIIAAVHDPSVKNVEYFRDRYGRFASADDEFAI